MQNFHPDHPVTRQTYLTQRCRRQLQQRHLMSEVKWVEPTLIPCESCQPSKGSHRKICWMVLFGFCWEAWMLGREGVEEVLRSFYGYFVRWKFEIGCGAGAAWRLLKYCSLIYDAVWYRLISSTHCRCKATTQLSFSPSTGKIWKFTRCSQYNKFGFFRWHPLEAHRFICIMRGCVCRSLSMCVH